MALIELQTTAISVEYNVLGSTSFQLIGTLATETIDFKIPDGSGGWMPLYSEDSLVQLTATNNIVSFHAPAKICVDKPITGLDAGVIVVA